MDKNCPKILCQLDNHLQCVNSVRWSLNGDMLASGGDDKLIMIWKKGKGPSAVFGNSGITKTSESWRCVSTLRGHAGKSLFLINLWSWIYHKTWYTFFQETFLICRGRHKTDGWLVQVSTTPSSFGTCLQCLRSLQFWRVTQGWWKALPGTRSANLWLLRATIAQLRYGKPPIGRASLRSPNLLKNVVVQPTSSDCRGHQMVFI